MGNLISFPIFDVFSYLIVGLLLIAACDFIFHTKTFFYKDWGLSATTIIVIAAYVIGHVVSFASSILFERQIVRNVLHPPVVYIMGNANPNPNLAERMVAKGFDVILGVQYFGEIEKTTQRKITEKSNPLTCTSIDTCRHLFWEAYNTVKQNKEAFERITTFHERANFSRNVSFASFVAVIFVSIQLWRRGTDKILTPAVEVYGLPRWMNVPLWQLAAFVFVGLVMFARYLYFLRAHTIEILTSYAYLR